MAIYNQDKEKSYAYTVEELAEAGKDLRALCLTGIYAGGSGHPGGSLSCADIVVSLFLNVANLCPSDPEWVKRDRIFFSAGHKAPALYAGLGLAGFFDPDEIATLRSLGSPFQGHPHKGPVRGLEVSSGSLGQGLGIAVGNALALRADGNTARVFCLMGDGEQQEGSIWEAVMMAGHSKLGNLCAIVDKNRLQIDGSVEEVLGVDPLDEKYKAFRWNVITINGHSLPEILFAFKEAEKVKDKPTLIIANTVKGKGVSYMEDQAGWHGIAPRNPEEFEKAIREIGSKRYTLEKAKELLEKTKKFQLESSGRVRQGMPGFSQDFFWNKQDQMKTAMVSTREGFGKGLKKAGEDPRVEIGRASCRERV